MNNRILKTLIFLFLFFPASFAAAANLEIELQVAEEVSPGQAGFFSYTISSDEAVEINYASYVDCPTAPVPLPEYITKEIGPVNPLQETYEKFGVESSYLPQTCKAVVEITSPVYLLEEKSFEIETDPAILFSVLSCKDKDCGEKSKVFVKGEKAYFNYESEISDLAVAAVLTAPDGAESRLIFPADSVLGQAGKYLLEVEAEKEGYRPGVQALELTVLQEEPKTVDKRVCNANSECETGEGENYQNCPQDCPLPIFKAGWPWYFWALVLLGAAGAVFAFFRLRRRL